MSVHTLLSVSVPFRQNVTIQWVPTSAPAVEDMLMLIPATLELIAQVRVTVVNLKAGNILYMVIKMVRVISKHPGSTHKTLP